MKTRICLAALVAAWICSSTALLAAPDKSAPAPETPLFYEMRTYYAAPGKLNELNARFRDHTLGLFEKHGMKNIGYWMPIDNPDQKLIYLLAFPNREQREQSWKKFFADPDWVQVQKASEANGKLVAKVESVFLTPTDYSPRIELARLNPPRLFELRTYTAAPGKLADLNTRFHEKTLALFTKHAMANIGYWMPADKAQGSDNTLIYIVAHKDQEAAGQSWKAFREDPVWQSAKRASEANGALTLTNGVRSVYMRPTDYSPIQ